MPINHPTIAASELAPSPGADSRPGSSSEAPIGHPPSEPALVKGQIHDAWSVAGMWNSRKTPRYEINWQSVH